MANEQPDTSPPSSRRQQELRALYQANISRGQPPYAGAQIFTLGELQWIMNERGWKGDSISFDTDKADLSQARFIRANLTGAQLNYANLSGAIFMMDTILDQAALANANLSGAYLQNVRGIGALLINAKLSDAQLYNVDLTSSRMEHTDLRGTRLEQVRLGGAWLVEATMDAGTALRDGLVFDASTLLSDVGWDGVSLSHVDWGQLPILGEEILASKERDQQNNVKSPQQRLAGYRIAARANKQVSAALRDQGLSEQGDHYAYRAQVLQRKSCDGKARRRSGYSGASSTV